MSHGKTGIHQAASRGNVLILPGMVVVLVFAFITWNRSAAAHRNAWESVLRTHDILNEIMRTSTMAREAECAIRGYFLNGDTELLLRTDEIVKRELMSSIDRLLLLTAQNDAQQRRVA
jgi:CHASE3 domain sensor protein